MKEPGGLSHHRALRVTSWSWAVPTLRPRFVGAGHGATLRDYQLLFDAHGITW